MFRRLITTTAALLATGLVLTGCGAANSGSTSTPDTSKPLRIMADVTPHSLLLNLNPPVDVVRVFVLVDPVWD